MKKNSGFSLIELIVVLGILLTLFGFIVIGLSTSQRRFSVTSARDTLISDIASQQTKSMNSISGSSAYGIYFQPGKYTLFKGETYSASDPENFEVELGENLEFSQVTFPAATIIFATKSGEISGFLDGANIITIRDVQNIDSTTVTINRYGVITDIN
ncbi:MAG: hypothetical protein A3A51_01700 [Candidatus Levybacteria bacterium RIFCSPLOWO2_01_FULL_39_10]|nr:MAG: hypothetical protein A3A51_01700 [Candidatus Levybacteria bacterium RIFCSPLOWO2_01_FULL_39_10]